MTGGKSEIRMARFEISTNRQFRIQQTHWQSHVFVLNLAPSKFGFVSDFEFLIPPCAATRNATTSRR